MRIVEPVHPVEIVRDDKYKQPLSIRDKKQRKDFKKFLDDALEKLLQNKRGEYVGVVFRISKLDKFR